MYELVYSQKARKTLKRLRRSGAFSMRTLEELLLLLIHGRNLPAHFKDHQLHGDLARYRECHLGFNLLLQYEKDEILKLITISKIGTHPELFGE